MYSWVEENPSLLKKLVFLFQVSSVCVYSFYVFLLFWSLNLSRIFHVVDIVLFWSLSCRVPYKFLTSGTIMGSCWHICSLTSSDVCFSRSDGSFLRDFLVLQVSSPFIVGKGLRGIDGCSLCTPAGARTSCKIQELK